MRLAASLAVERAGRIMPFGLTDRQTRFLNIVMLHSGVFVCRQYVRSPESRRGEIVEAAGTEGPKAHLH
jgi:hypothetical protein